MGLLGQSTIAWSLFAYLVAAIPVGLVIGRLRGVDIRQIGSGNIGATNAVRALGRKWGLIVFALDVLKAFTPVALAARADALGGLPEPEAAIAIVGAAATLGHIYPIYLGFRGGKGVACALGVFFAIVPFAGLLAVVLYLQTLILTRGQRRHPPHPLERRARRLSGARARALAADLVAPPQQPPRGDRRRQGPQARRLVRRVERGSPTSADADDDPCSLRHPGRRPRVLTLVWERPGLVRWIAGTDAHHPLRRRLRRGYPDRGAP